MNTIKTDAEIIAELNKAVALHRDSAEKLVHRMKALLEPVPGATALTVAGRRIAYRTVYAACSQWGNGAYPHTGSTKAYVIDGSYVIGTPDCSFFDGSNHQEQINAYRWSLKEGPEDGLRRAPVGMLRDIAKELPAALLKYAACCIQGSEENNNLAVTA